MTFFGWFEFVQTDDGAIPPTRFSYEEDDALVKTVMLFTSRTKKLETQDNGLKHIYIPRLSYVHQCLLG